MSRTVHHEFRNAVKLLRKEPAALAVYMIYVSRMDNQAVAFPSIRGLSKDTGWSTRKVQDARTYLTNMGLLTRIDNPSDNPMDRRAFYRVNDSFEFAGKTYYTLFNGAQVPDARDEKEHMHVLPDSTPRATPSNVDAVARKVVPVSSDARDTDVSLDGVAKSEPQAATKRKKADKKPPKPRGEYEHPDTLYETVESELFGFVGADTEPYHYTAPPGGITQWLRGKISRYNKTELVGAPDTEQTPEDVRAFVRWWKRTRKGADLPQGVDTFARHYRKFLTDRPHRSSTPAMHVPLAEHDDMLDALLEDVG